MLAILKAVEGEKPALIALVARNNGMIDATIYITGP